jgi:uncharacterized protein
MEGYNFSWKDIGDIKLGRPNLGPTTYVAVYRLMQYTMRAVLEKEFGDEKARKLFYTAGYVAGSAFCISNLDTKLPFNDFMALLQKKLLELSMGILKIEKSDADQMKIVLTVSEDLDCSGLPVNGYTVCDYDEGFIAGIMNVYTGYDFDVKEIDCWSTGERTCRFTVNQNKV